MDYRNDNPFMPEGVELDQFWFCGGRIGAALGHRGGLTSLVYYGRRPELAGRRRPVAPRWKQPVLTSLPKPGVSVGEQKSSPGLP